MAPQTPCDRYNSIATHLWLNAAITHVCGLAPDRTDLLDPLSTRLDELEAEHDIDWESIEYDVPTGLSETLIKNVLSGLISLDDAEARFYDYVSIHPRDSR